MTTALKKMDEPDLTLARPEHPQDLLRLAVERGTSVDVIERLMVVRRELNAEQAKKDFDDALAEFQSNCPIIQKTKAVTNKGGGSVRYYYAPLDAIVFAVRGLLKEHGFSYTLDTVSDDKGIKAICKITHRGGHSQLSEFRVPLDPEGFMNAQQKVASALTFAKRYAFCNSLGILTSDEDIDGQTEKQKPKGPSNLQPDTTALKDLAAQLWTLLKPVRGHENNWNGANQYLWDEALIHDDESAPNFTASRFVEVINKTKTKMGVK